MLKQLTTALLIAFAGTQATAQEVNDRPGRPEPYIGHELVVSHGILPANQLFAGWINVFNYTNNTATGALGITYRYHLTRTISMGMAVMYEHEDGTWRTSSGLLSSFFGATQFYGTFDRTCFTIAPEVTFNYGDVADGMLRLYGMMGVGFTIRQQNTVLTGSTDPGLFTVEGNVPNVARTHLNMQLTPFGMRFGKALGGFVELGIGYKGIFNYGVTYRF